MSETLRETARQWVAENLPPSLVGESITMYGPASDDAQVQADFELWRQRLAAQGWGAPTWPEQYGGAGLNAAEAKIVAREIRNAGSLNPIPYLAGMGVTMVGPTLMEYGTEEQKLRHLPGMGRSDLANHRLWPDVFRRHRRAGRGQRRGGGHVRTHVRRALGRLAQVLGCQQLRPVGRRDHWHLS